MDRVERIIEAIQDKKGKNSIHLDLSKVEGTIFDGYIICNADSTTQVDAIVQNIEEKLEKELSEKAIRIDGLANGYWVAMDYGDLAVHVFLTEARDYYRLEELWFDAETTRYDALD